jgi:hypothetical protein
MALRLIRSPETRKSAQVIIAYFSALGRTLVDPGGREQFNGSRDPALPPRVAKAISDVSREFEENGSPQLRLKTAEARKFLRTFEGMTLDDAIRRISAMKPADLDTPLIKPADFSPGSRRVDWMLIRQHLPEEEGKPVTGQSPQ